MDDKLKKSQSVQISKLDKELNTITEQQKKPVGAQTKEDKAIQQCVPCNKQFTSITVCEDCGTKLEPLSSHPSHYPKPSVNQTHYNSIVNQPAT